VLYFPLQLLSSCSSFWFDLICVSVGFLLIHSFIFVLYKGSVGSFFYLTPSFIYQFSIHNILADLFWVIYILT
jgi:hypothetical protein